MSSTRSDTPKKQKIQCKNIPEIPILSFLDSHPRSPIYRSSGYPCDNPVNSAMPEDTPYKVALAKMRSLIKRGLVWGCCCGCRGDFELTDKGKTYLETWRYYAITSGEYYVGVDQPSHDTDSVTICVARLLKDGPIKIVDLFTQEINPSTEVVPKFIDYIGQIGPAPSSHETKVCSQFWEALRKISVGASFFKERKDEQP